MKEFRILKGHKKEVCSVYLASNLSIKVVRRFSRHWDLSTHCLSHDSDLLSTPSAISWSAAQTITRHGSGAEKDQGMSLLSFPAGEKSFLRLVIPMGKTIMRKSLYPDLGWQVVSVVDCSGDGAQ